MAPIPLLVERIQQVLQADGRIVLALLFGSLAQGTSGDRSDIDIGIAGIKPFSIQDLSQLHGEYELLFNRQVDFIDIRQADGLILYKAITGIPLKDNSALRTDLSIKSLDFHENMMPIINKARLARAREFVHGY